MSSGGLSLIVFDLEICEIRNAIFYFETSGFKFVWFKSSKEIIFMVHLDQLVFNFSVFEKTTNTINVQNTMHVAGITINFVTMF